jgi:hypothetical protein
MNLVVERLKKLGLKEREGLVFTWKLHGADDVLGWLGLGKATSGLKKGEARIHPSIGVRHQDVERLVAELRDEKFHSYRPMTYFWPLYGLMPQSGYFTWDVTSTPADAPVAEDLANAVEQYGFPFVQSLSSLDELIAAFEAQKMLHQQDIFRLPAALFLAGDLARATEVIERELLKLGDRTDAAAMEIQAFAPRMLERIRASRRLG